MDRRSAHAKPAPDGWTPVKFDQVWLPPVAPFLTTARAIIDRVLDTDLVRITYPRNGRTIERVMLIADLRPTGRKWNPTTRTFTKGAAK